MIELLVVIAIIGLLAAMVIPATGHVLKTRRLKVAQSEINEFATAIDNYKSKLGFYPPDNPINLAINQLYFELSGTVFDSTKNIYTTLDGSSQMTVSQFSTVYGGNVVNGFMNSSSSAQGTDEKPAPVNFIKDLRTAQVGQLNATGSGSYENAILVSSIEWQNYPTESISTPFAAKDGLNPIRYVSSHPKYNVNSYDLWIDLVIGAQTNRVSNWSGQPFLVGTTNY